MGIECKINNIILPKPYIEYSNISRPVFCGANNSSIIYAAKDTVCIQPLINHGNNKAQGGNQIHLCTKYDVNEKNNKSVLTIACMSPNGRIVVAGSTDGRLYVWNYHQDNDPLQKWELSDYLGNIRHDGNCIKDFAFTPDSNYLAVVGLNGGLFVDLSKKNIVGKLAGYSQPLFSVAINKSKVTSIVTCGMNEKSYLWFHKYDKMLECQFSNTTNGAISCVRFSGDGEHLATCGENGCIEGWCLQNGEKDSTLRISEYPLIHMAWAPDSQHIVVSSLDYVIRIVNFTSGSITSRVILGEEFPTVGVGICWASSNWIVSLCSDGFFRGFNTVRQNEFDYNNQFLWAGLQGNCTTMHSRVFSDVRLSVISDSNGSFLFVDYQNHCLEVVGFQQLTIPEEVVCVKLSQTAGIFCTKVGHVFVFEIPPKLTKSAKQTEQLIQHVTSHSKKTSSFIKKNSIKVHHQSLTVASVADHGPGYLNFSLQGPTLIHHHSPTFIKSMSQIKHRIIDVILLNDDQQVAILSENGEISVFSFEEPMVEFKLLFSLQLNGDIVTASSTVDGGMLAIVIKPHKNYPQNRLKNTKKRNFDPPCIIELYEIQNTATSDGFNFLCVYNHIQTEIECIALNASGTLLAVANDKHVISVTDTQLGKQIISTEWAAHKNKITCMSWHPTLYVLATGSLDCFIGVWNVKQPKSQNIFSVPESGGIMGVSVIDETSILVAGKAGTVFNLTF
ncbi:uncharacterized protein LOC128884349 [Hylaeus volcanicus]|uniref:uncharacterized protein LOC128884349 n=1 Tax=Hylaeus volcanicus TaxID=313075 RepID=UPI0023B824ED|nr:uncharacterized protein LOC128884349 [Hylaeus volcanicus]